MMKMKNKLTRIAVAAVFTIVMSSNLSFAASHKDNEDIDSLIQNQQQILDQLNAKKQKATNDEIVQHMKNLENQVSTLQNKKQYDAEGAVYALSAQVDSLKEQLSAQIEMQNKLLDEIKKMREEQAAPAQAATATSVNNAYSAPVSSTAYLVNPAPNENVGYTQDAVDAQGNSTMTFRYAPNQLYKIYCRTGYLTDLSFKDGEKIKFVGGGDTSAWSVSSTDVDGTPHLYIKPTTKTSSTNIIVTTNKHSYQILLNISDWYNPMVTWTYDGEDHVKNMIETEKDARTVTDKFAVSSYEQLNFDYEITGDSRNKPTMIFDDGQKTVIKFKKLGAKMPVLFARENGKRELSLVNYNIKDNCYIVDKIFSTLELRYSDKDIVRIKRK